EGQSDQAQVLRDVCRRGRVQIAHRVGTLQEIRKNYKIHDYVTKSYRHGSCSAQRKEEVRPTGQGSRGSEWPSQSLHFCSSEHKAAYRTRAPPPLSPGT